MENDSGARRALFKRQKRHHANDEENKVEDDARNQSIKPDKGSEVEEGVNTEDVSVAQADGVHDCEESLDYLVGDQHSSQDANSLSWPFINHEDVICGEQSSILDKYEGIISTPPAGLENGCPYQQQVREKDCPYQQQQQCTSQLLAPPEEFASKDAALQKIHELNASNGTNTKQVLVYACSSKGKVLARWGYFDVAFFKDGRVEPKGCITANNIQGYNLGSFNVKERQQRPKSHKNFEKEWQISVRVACEIRQQENNAWKDGRRLEAYLQDIQETYVPKDVVQFIKERRNLGSKEQIWDAYKKHKPVLDITEKVFYYCAARPKSK